MQIYAKKKILTIDSTDHEMSRFLIKPILRQLYKNMHLHKNTGLSYQQSITYYKIYIN
jgi:hypothetical protein